MHIIDTRILISMQSLRVLQVVCRHTQRHVAEKLACTIGELCGHWDRVMYALVPLTCMHGGSGCVVTMATTFCGNLVVADFLKPTSTSLPARGAGSHETVGWCGWLPCHIELRGTDRT